MNSQYKPNKFTFKAGGVIAPYSFVKFGSDDETVIQCSSADELAIGVAPGAPIGQTNFAAGDLVEVSLPGGGALVKLAGTLARGAEVATNASGLGKAAAAGGYIAGILMGSGVSGDLVPMLVHPYQKN